MSIKVPYAKESDFPEAMEAVIHLDLMPVPPEVVGPETVHDTWKRQEYERRQLEGMLQADRNYLNTCVDREFVRRVGKRRPLSRKSIQRLLPALTRFVATHAAKHMADRRRIRTLGALIQWTRTVDPLKCTEALEEQLSELTASRGPYGRPPAPVPMPMSPVAYQPRVELDEIGDCAELPLDFFM